MTSRTLLGVCGLALAVGGCNSTGVGNPAPALRLSLAIVNDDAPELADAGAGGELGVAGDASLADALGGASDAGSAGEAEHAGSLMTAEGHALPAHAVQDAIVVLGELRFLPCDSTQGGPFSLPGPFVVDLKKKTTAPEIPAVPSIPGGYCGLDAPLAAASAPADLAGRSVFFDGYRSDGTFFLVYANMIATLRMRAKPGSSWEGHEPPPLFFWALRPRRWLMPAELNMAEPVPYADHLRAVVIDADRHAGLFMAIRKRLAGVSTLYADANADGIFDDPDRAAAVGEGLDNPD